jgi:ankyrin repeat protein
VLIKALLEGGAKLDAVNKDGEPLIYAASKKGRADVILELASHQVDVNAPAEKGVDAGWTPLQIAAYWGHLDAVRALLSCGADRKRTVEWKSFLRQRHWTAEQIAVERKHSNIAKLVGEA